MSEGLEPDQVYRVPAAGDSPTVVTDASRVIETEATLREIGEKVGSGWEFAVFDPEDAVPGEAIPLVVLETTRTLDRPRLFFVSDRPRSPRKRLRRVAALVPPSASGNT